MNSKILIPGILILVVGILGFFLLGRTNTQNNQTQLEQTPSTEVTVDETEQVDSERVEVMTTSAGFVPATITIKKGSKVVWKNQSGETSNVSSAPHPTHSLWPFLNLGDFADGSEVSVTFENAGTYNYHNHLNSSQRGTVIVIN